MKQDLKRLLQVSKSQPIHSEGRSMWKTTGNLGARSGVAPFNFSWRARARTLFMAKGCHQHYWLISEGSMIGYLDLHYEDVEFLSWSNGKCIWKNVFIYWLDGIDHYIIIMILDNWEIISDIIRKSFHFIIMIHILDIIMISSCIIIMTYLGNPWSWSHRRGYLITVPACDPGNLDFK